MYERVSLNIITGVTFLSVSWLTMFSKGKLLVNSSVKSYETKKFYAERFSWQL